MRILAIFIGLALVAPLAGAAAPGRADAEEAVKTIIVYDGIVDAGSADRFLDLIAASHDQIIGLKVTVEPQLEENRRYTARYEEDRLVITSGDPMDAPREVVVNGEVGRSIDRWTLDGFYLIKSGGAHAAGALSSGAIPVDEAMVRLAPHVRIVTRNF